MYVLVVSGDTNFEMKQTGLTVGGFIQPSVACNLLEQHANVEKGLCQRFLWFVPKPTPIPFDDLEKVNEVFSSYLGMYIVDERKIIHILMILYYSSPFYHTTYYL